MGLDPSPPPLASSDLKLPDNGIRSNHPMTVETNAKSGPVEGISVFFIKPVGGSFCPFSILILILMH